MLAGDPVRAEAALADAEDVAREIGDRWFLSTILVDRAHVLLAQERPKEAAAAVAAIEEVPSPNDIEWSIKRLAARGKLAAREGRAERRAGRGPRGGGDRRADRPVPLSHRRLARSGRGRRSRGRSGGGRGGARGALRFYRAKGNVAAADQLATVARPSSGV